MGVPGRKKRKNTQKVSFFSFCRKRRDWTFSRGKNTSTARTPKRRTSRNTATRAPIRHSSVPSKAPKA